MNLPFLKNKLSSKNPEFPSKINLAIQLKSNGLYGIVYTFDGKNMDILGVDKVLCPNNLINSFDEGELKKEQYLLQQLKDKVSAFSSSSFKKPVVGIPLNNTISKLISIRYKRKNPKKKITKKEISNILQNTLKKADIELNEDFKDIYEDSYAHLEIVQYTIAFTKIDGYITTDLHNQRGSVIEISIYVTYAPSSYLKNIVDYFSLANFKPQALTTSVYSLSKYFNYLNPKEDNYILVDLGAFTTEIGIIFGKELIATTYFNIGYKDFFIYASEIMGINPKELLSSKELLDKSKSILRDIQDFWALYFSSKLSSLKGIKVFPSNIYFVGNNQSKISTESFFTSLESLSFKGTPTLKTIDLGLENVLQKDLIETNYNSKKFLGVLSLAYLSKNLFNK